MIVEDIIDVHILGILEPNNITMLNKNIDDD